MEERIAELERRCRGQQRALLVLVAAVLAVALMGQAEGPANVGVRGLRLLDDAGKVRAELGLEDGQPALTLWQADGERVGACFKLSRAGDPTLTMLSQDRERFIVLQDSDKAQGSSVMVSRKGGPGAILFANADGGSLALFDDHGQPIKAFK